VKIHVWNPLTCAILISRDEKTGFSGCSMSVYPTGAKYVACSDMCTKSSDSMHSEEHHKFEQ
jgi:hypothetical protein